MNCVFHFHTVSTSVLPWHADGTQSQRQRDVLRPVGNEGNEVRCATDCVGSPAATTNHMASHGKCWVIALDHSAEKQNNTKTEEENKASVNQGIATCSQSVVSLCFCCSCCIWMAHTRKTLCIQVCCGILDNCVMSNHVAD